MQFRVMTLLRLGSVHSRGPGTAERLLKMVGYLDLAVPVFFIDFDFLHITFLPSRNAPFWIRILLSVSLSLSLVLDRSPSQRSTAPHRNKKTETANCFFVLCASNPASAFGCFVAV